MDQSPGTVAWFQNPTARRAREGTSATASFSGEIAKKIRQFHRSVPGYEPTPLVPLKGLASHLGISRVWVKDESFRFGLNAFKALGASYALIAVLSERLDLRLGECSFLDFILPRVRPKISSLTCVTATDGNHGRAVAWIAKQVGCGAVVYMPKGSSRNRFNHIKELGADVSVINGNYDDAVRMAERQASKKGWLLIQDTAKPGYVAVPRMIMQGYMTLLDETFEQLGDQRPTHVFFQCGVGSFAGACLAYLVQRFGNRRPIVAVVEPTQADCYYQSMTGGEGKPCIVGGELNTIMDGLACGEPSLIGWEILCDHADVFVSCPDEVAVTGMKTLAFPQKGDQPIVSGESGAVTTGLLCHLVEDPACQKMKDALGIDRHSSVLLISTEGDTDRDSYRRIVGKETALKY